MRDPAIYCRLCGHTTRAGSSLHRARGAALPRTQPYWRGCAVDRRRRDSVVLAKRYERLDKDIDPAIPHRRADRRILDASADSNKYGYARGCDVITAYLVGDLQLLERLRALPDAINSGLLRGITQVEHRPPGRSERQRRHRERLYRQPICRRTGIRFCWNGQCQEQPSAHQGGLWSADRREDDQRAGLRSPHGSPRTLFPALGARGDGADHPRRGGGGSGGGSIAMIAWDTGLSRRRAADDRP